VARQYALAGAHVVMAARSMDKLQDIKDELVAKDGVNSDR
jgi:NADP-dependent 3-hydroxy acid dehydrogenase YdfG